jgi:hypothetical protein
VALQLDFDSPSGLRNALRRYTGHGPAALRAAGGLRVALGAFAEACAARRAADAARPRRARRGGPGRPAGAAADRTTGRARAEAAGGSEARDGVASAAAGSMPEPALAAGATAGGTGTPGESAAA